MSKEMRGGKGDEDIRNVRSRGKRRKGRRRFGMNNRN